MRVWLHVSTPKSTLAAHGNAAVVMKEQVAELPDLKVTSVPGMSGFVAFLTIFFSGQCFRRFLKQYGNADGGVCAGVPCGFGHTATPTPTAVGLRPRARNDAAPFQSAA